MKVIIAPNLNSPFNLKMIWPAYQSEVRKGMTDDEFVDYCIKVNIEAGEILDLASAHIIEDTAFPADHVCDRLPGECVFFDAFEWVDNKVQVNMPKARDIHMDIIRAERNKELAAKDITWMKAAEAGDTSAQATIGTEKQVLRDIPQTFDLTTDNDTPEELKEKWPEGLPKE